MKTHNRSNALLVELMIVILFFMLSATILLQVFAASTNQSRNADITTRALTGAQNTADRLYAAPDAQKCDKIEENSKRRVYFEKERII